jgi:hypothetical protein
LFNSRWASPPTSGNDRGRRPCYAARCKSKSRLPQEIQVQSRSGTTEIINAVGPLQFFESGYAHYNSNHVLLLWLTGNCPQKRIPTRLGYAHFGVAPLWTRISVLNAEGGELLAHSASMKTVGWRQRRRWRTGSRASKKTKREGRSERRLPAFTLIARHSRARGCRPLLARSVSRPTRAIWLSRLGGAPLAGAVAISF